MQAVNCRNLHANEATSSLRKLTHPQQLRSARHLVVREWIPRVPHAKPNDIVYDGVRRGVPPCAGTGEGRGAHVLRTSTHGIVSTRKRATEDLVLTLKGYRERQKTGVC